MNVNLFAANISARLNQPVDDWLKYFPAERREKILAYRFNADRNRTLWAELLARYAVAEKFSCPLEKVHVYRDATGKPHIAELPVKISLAHAGDWVVCSVGDVKSGVDVEFDSTNALEIAESFFLPSEFKKIISLPKNLHERQFLIYWTLKESRFKLTGDENFLQADCEKILAGNGKIIGKIFFLRDGAVVGVCTYQNQGGQLNETCPVVPNPVGNLFGLSEYAGRRSLQHAFPFYTGRRYRHESTCRRV